MDLLKPQRISENVAAETASCRALSYDVYLDKVYGCFLGKCIGGTAGGPAEGRKELLDYPLHEPMLHVALPNDDLDLQILWLELLETAGADITARDMAREFYEKVPYGPGEYGYFEKNFARGIYPPLSGKYNNRYYKNGMGCPIRAEIWACLFPGAPHVARHYVEMDGSLDHERDSIDAEQFLAALEGEMFFTDSLTEALDKALVWVSPMSKIGRALRDTIAWHAAGHDWKMTRSLILRQYGHADCTNLYQNMAFILLALLYGEGDFRETVRLGLACGYDTDCICATAASVLGIRRGASRMLGEDGLSDTGLAIGVRTVRRSGSIADLARDVAAVGVAMTALYREQGTIEMTDAPALPSLPTRVSPAFTLEAEYITTPTVSPDAVTELHLCLTSHLPSSADVTISVETPPEICLQAKVRCITVESGETVRIPCRAFVLPDARRLAETNLCTVTLRGTFGEVRDTFGLVGCAIWYRFGPFLQNIRDITHILPHEPYGKHIPLLPGETEYDVTREFHLGGIADIDCAFVPEDEPFLSILPDGTAMTLPERISLSEDLFDLAEIQPYEGPHVDYLIRYIESPEDRRVEIALGHTAPFKLWLNGTYVGGSNRCKWWTCENMHFSATLKKGVNTVILKCARVSEHAQYSFILKHRAWLQYADFASVIL